MAKAVDNLTFKRKRSLVSNWNSKLVGIHACNRDTHSTFWILLFVIHVEALSLAACSVKLFEMTLQNQKIKAGKMQSFANEAGHNSGQKNKKVLLAPTKKQ